MFTVINRNAESAWERQQCSRAKSHKRRSRLRAWMRTGRTSSWSGFLRRFPLLSSCTKHPCGSVNLATPAMGSRQLQAQLITLSDLFFFFHFLSFPEGWSDFHILTGERRLRLVDLDRSGARGRVPPSVVSARGSLTRCLSGGRAELLAASPELPQQLCPPMQMKFWVQLLCLSSGRSGGSLLVPLSSLLWKPLLSRTPSSAPVNLDVVFVVKRVGFVYLLLNTIKDQAVLG